jgi:hypothetical protein
VEISARDERMQSGVVDHLQPTRSTALRRVHTEREGTRKKGHKEREGTRKKGTRNAAPNAAPNATQHMRVVCGMHSSPLGLPARTQQTAQPTERVQTFTADETCSYIPVQLHTFTADETCSYIPLQLHTFTADEMCSVRPPPTAGFCLRQMVGLNRIKARLTLPTSRQCAVPSC